MKKIYSTQFLLLAMLFAVQSMAQTYVLIPASTDPTAPTDIFPYIMGDTTATGERNDNNTIYQLTNGAVYITTGRIVNKPEWKLHIEAADLTNTDSKAIITRIPNASGTYPDIMRPEGNVTLRNLWFVAGERGALEQHDWGKIRYMGENTRVIAEDCIFEKDRGGFFQLRANGIKLYVTNCVLRNGGNRRIIQGNGRGVDARNFAIDSMVMRNTIVHNIQDRFFRSQGGSEPHNYIEIDNCTSFNTIGRHGFIQLGRVVEAKITNNLFIDPIMLGSSPFYTNEQSQPDDDLHKVITLDTLYDNTALTISNNNIFWNQPVMDYWASNDTVSAPGFLSDLVMDNLGAAASDAYFTESLTLNSVPGSILEYVEDLYANPAAEDMYDFIVEDVVVAGTAFDSGNLFDFSTFDPCYDSSSQSASAGTHGGAVGALFLCSELTNVFEVAVNEELELQTAPNPAGEFTQITYNLKQASQVELSVFDMNGRLVETLTSAKLPAGNHQTTWDNLQNKASGMYFVNLQTEEGRMYIKVMVK